MVSARLFFVALFISIYTHCCDFTEYHIIDQSRQERYPHNAKHPYREFMMHVWAPLIAQDKQCPLILFSHGLGGTYNGMSYTHLCESIASQGYVVASVSHTYGCKLIQFSDGRVAHYNFPVFSTHYQPGKHMFDVEVERWVEDMVCALSECVRYNSREGNFLYNRIDISRVGIIGHSLGGSTAIQVCRRDSRVKAAINLDGPLYGENAKIPFVKPMMFIFGSSVLPSQKTTLGIVPHHHQFIWRQCFNQYWLPVLNAFSARLPSVSTIIIDGIVHDTFTDFAFTPDLSIQPWLRDGAVAQAMISEHIVNFLKSII